HGNLVGSVPNGARLRNRLRFMMTGRVELDRTHLQHFSTGTLRTVIKAFFERVRVVPVSGRHVWMSKYLFANYLLFAGEVPCGQRGSSVTPACHSTREPGSLRRSG